MFVGIFIVQAHQDNIFQMLSLRRKKKLIKWASLFSSDVSRGSANKETKRQEEDKEHSKVAEGRC